VRKAIGAAIILVSGLSTPLTAALA